MSRGPYVLLALINLFFIYLFVNDLLSKAVWGSTRPIYTKFSPYGSYLIVNYRFDPLFPMAQGTLPWQPILV